MKNRIPSSLWHKLATLMLLWAMVLLNTDILSAQTVNRDLDREILVYILPDSLEIPTEVRDVTNIDRVTIRSNTLAEALGELSITEITRSFPDWAADDSVRVREDGRVIQRPRFDRVFTIFLHANQTAEEVIVRLESLPSVLYAEKHMDASLTNDPQYAAQWHLNNNGQAGGTPGADIRAEQAWQIFTGSSDIKIGIFDSAVDLSHTEFAGKISGDNIRSNGTEFDWSHGTHVAGIAAARANNSHSGRGVDWNAQIVSKEIFDGFGNFLGTTNVVNKIMDAVDNDGVHVLNNSWGGPSYSSTIRQAFAYAYMMNRVSTAAMGNLAEDGNPTLYPAAFGQGVIAVGGTQNNDERSPFAQTGSHIRVVAPAGVNYFPNYSSNDILSTIRNNNTAFISGTSMATPQVSGIASLLKGYNPNLYNDDIQQIIQLSADKVAGMSGQNWTQEYGFGRVNAYEALKRLQSPYVLDHHTTTGGTVHSTSNPYNIWIYGATGIPDGVYTVRRREVRKWVSFPSYMDEVWVWGRGVASVGWNLTESSQMNFAMGFTEPVTVTSAGTTLSTFIYEVKKYNKLGQLVADYGWQPTTHQNVEFAYTVHGIPGTAPPPSPTISINTSGSNPILNWNAVSGVDSYNIYRGTVQGAPGNVTCSHVQNFMQIQSTTSATFTDFSVMIDPFEHILVCYYVTSVNQDGESNPSNKVGTHGMAPFSTLPGDDNEQTEKNDSPDSFALKPNYPNPFNPTTTIAYDLPEQSEVLLQVFDVMGRRIATLEASTQSAGSYHVTFNATNLSSGIYIVRLKASGISGNSFVRENKMQLVK